MSAPSSAGLLSVADALKAVLAAGRRTGQETVSLDAAFGRTLSADLTALRTQPPFPASAMDGYAVVSDDTQDPSRVLVVIGESAAGRRFAGAVRPGQAVRIFTGAPVPDGADAILIQENAVREGDTVRATVPVAAGWSIRRAGLDFAAGQVLLPAGRRLDGFDLALAGAMGHAAVSVARAPLVAILATGDELVPPGTAPGPDQIVASNSILVAGVARDAGARVLDLGIAADHAPTIAQRMRQARDAGADVIVTLGGASVGDHDLVRDALNALGFELGFWRIAMRPGKPLIHGRWGGIAVLGLPGNPVSSAVCALLFLAPLLRAMQGDPDAGADRSEEAELGADLPANGDREDFVRAALTLSRTGLPVATPHPVQDSAMLSTLSASRALIVRPAGEAARRAGETCRILRIR